MFFFAFIFCVIALMFLFHTLTKEYLNPYKLTMVFGPKGSGKTTTLTYLACKYQKLGWTVYSTEPIPGCYPISGDLVGYVHLKQNSVLLVDEVGCIWDNRDFKSFKKEVRNWFKYQRHYRVRVYLFSQTFDIDKKLRDLTDDMFLMQKKFRVFTWAKRIVKKIVLVEASAESPSKIDENLTFDPFLFWIFGSRMLIYIPKYAKLFDSFCDDGSILKDYDPEPYAGTLTPDQERNILRRLMGRFSNRNSDDETFDTESGARLPKTADKL